MRRRHFLHLYSVKELALYLGYPEVFLQKVARNNKRFYSINTNKLDKRGKKRIIVYPVDTYKELLRRIDKRILSRLDFPGTFQGAVKGGSTIKNAQIHIGQSVLVKFDLKSFYPNIKPQQVFNAFIKRGFSRSTAEIITKIVTVQIPKPHLPQGFPPSPKIALMVLENFEKRLYQLQKKHGWKVGFWIDDIAISGNIPIDNFKRTIIKMLEEEGFIVNEGKTTIIKRGGRKVITGLIVSEKINVPKEMVDAINTDIYVITKFGVHDFYSGRGKLNGYKSEQRVKTSLLGKINYVIQINPTTGAKLKTKYDKIFWPD